ncbi:MAG: hypothetical protein MUC87_10875 [Bacteroidia bacterium]|jgi:hypothetical protein|nr:hypothetical protein [Bacteroidia bacterium]
MKNLFLSLSAFLLLLIGVSSCSSDKEAVVYEIIGTTDLSDVIIVHHEPEPCDTIVSHKSKVGDSRDQFRFSQAAYNMTFGCNCINFVPKSGGAAPTTIQINNGVKVWTDGNDWAVCRMP